MILKRILKSGKNQFIRMTDRSYFSFTNTPSNCVTDLKRFNKADITLTICDMNVVASHRCISHTMAGGEQHTLSEVHVKLELSFRCESSCSVLYTSCQKNQIVCSIKLFLLPRFSEVIIQVLF
jgi:hypothetical protein